MKILRKKIKLKQIIMRFLIKIILIISAIILMNKKNQKFFRIKLMILAIILMNRKNKKFFKIKIILRILMNRKNQKFFKIKIKTIFMI